MTDRDAEKFEILALALGRLYGLDSTVLLIPISPLHHAPKNHIYQLKKNRSELNITNKLRIHPTWKLLRQPTDVAEKIWLKDEILMTKKRQFTERKAQNNECGGNGRRGNLDNVNITLGMQCWTPRFSSLSASSTYRSWPSMPLQALYLPKCSRRDFQPASTEFKQSREIEAFDALSSRNKYKPSHVNHGWPHHLYHSWPVLHSTSTVSGQTDKYSYREQLPFPTALSSLRKALPFARSAAAAVYQIVQARLSGTKRLASTTSS